MFRLIVVSYPTPGSSPTPSASHGSSTPAATPQEPSCSAPPIPRETTSVEVHNLPKQTSQPSGHRTSEGNKRRGSRRRGRRKGNRRRGSRRRGSRRRGSRRKGS